MPELPEVETIVGDLRKKVLGRTFIDFWTDFKKMIRLRQGSDRQVKKINNLEKFKKEIKGKKIQKVWRRGKNILFELSGNKTLLIHQKLTGHLLLGKWGREKARPPGLRPRLPSLGAKATGGQAGEVGRGEWKSEIPGPLTEDPMNRFLHLIFWLDNDQMLALSDLRKFAKVELWDSEQLKESQEIKSLGPEPLEKSFTFEKFKQTIQQTQGKVKQVLMDQTVIAGIGNIYSDEILWKAKIHPFKEVKKLKREKLKRIYQAIKKILAIAVKLQGESISDFRKLSGEKGYYDKARKVYRKEGEKCQRCGAIIKRLKLAGRSTHFCPRCQKL